MHCMLMDLLDGFEVLSTTEETLFNSQKIICYHGQKRHFKETKPTKKNGSYTLAMHDNKLTTYNHSSLLRI